MKQYTITFSIFGNKYRTKVNAESEIEAKNSVIRDICKVVKFDDCKENLQKNDKVNDLFSFLNGFKK